MSKAVLNSTLHSEPDLAEKDASYAINRTVAAELAVQRERAEKLEHALRSLIAANDAALNRRSRGLDPIWDGALHEAKAALRGRR
jgi:hypothetical protein